MKAWMGAPLLKEPEEWSHLPLKGRFRGLDPEVQAFMCRVSSYDNEGHLLPKFQRLRDRIEGKVPQKERKPRDRVENKSSEAGEVTEEDGKAIWISLAALLVAAASGVMFYQRRRTLKTHRR